MSKEEFNSPNKPQQKKFPFLAIAQSITVTICSSLLIPATTAHAATAEKASIREEIVVFARKREESIQDIPFSVSAFSGEALRLKGLNSSLELTKVTPNLTTNSAYGETQPNYTMRGISVANEFNPNQASPIGIYVDESYMSNRISHGLSLFDVERVEVLRGPQGTLYGRNTTGGAISVYTRKPTLESEANGYAEIGLGNFNRREFNAALDTTLNESGTLGVRLAVRSLEADGSIENLVPGKKDSNSLDTQAGRITLRFKPSDTFDSTLAIYSGQNKPTSSGVFSLGVDIPTGNPAPGGANPFTGYTRSDLSFHQVEMEEAGIYKTEGSGVLLRMQWDVSDNLQITSITSYDEGEQDLDFDADGSPVDLLTDKWLADFEQFNQEIRANITVSDRTNLVLGGYYGTDDVHIDYHNRFFGFFSLFAFETDTDSLQERKSLALFADGDIQLSDKLKLSAGLRWTDDSILVKNYTAVYAGVQTIGPDFSTPEETSSEVTGRIALDYQISDSALGYITYSKGYRGGAFNGATSSGLQSLGFVAPEFVDAYEAGLKYQSEDGRLIVNSALFYNEYSDQQLQELINAVSFLRNAGESTLQGLEVEVNFAATDSVTISGSLGILDAEYDKLTLSGVNLDGNQLPFAPETTANVGVNWTIGEFYGFKVSSYLNAAYFDHQFFSPFNEEAGDQNLQQDSYLLVDGNLRFESERFYGSLWVKNLTEEEYFVYGIDTNALGYSYLVQGTPRTFGINLGVRF